MLKPRPGIMDIAPYRGGDAKLPGQTRVMRLASNESPLGASPRAVEAYRAIAPELHRYPDGAAEDLRAAISRTYDLPAAQIVCGAGSDELISLLTRSFAGPGDEVLYSQYAFLMYGIAAKTVGATPVAVPAKDYGADVDAMLTKVTPRTRIVFLANPNNPTGTLLPAADVRRLLKKLPEDVLFILDAAYAEYVGAPDYEDGAALVRDHGNAVMLRTFSKIYGLAALRLGWGYSSPQITDVLNRVRGPFNVPAPAQAAGVAALADKAHLEKARAHNDLWLPWLAAKLTEIGLQPVPSAGNFLLVRFPDPALTADMAAEFLNGRGILPRKMGPYGMADCLRITIGLADENQAVVEALAAFAAPRSAAHAMGAR
jgi:histidinol-phosphate aminotransferase